MAKLAIAAQLGLFGIAIVKLSLVVIDARVADAAQTKRQAGEIACSASYLRGTYGFVAFGTEAKAGPFIAVGRLEFDGKGRLTMVATVSEKGHIVRGAHTTAPIR
jgi:hypothetical protein